MTSQDSDDGDNGLSDSVTAPNLVAGWGQEEEHLPLSFSSKPFYMAPDFCQHGSSNSRPVTLLHKLQTSETNAYLFVLEV